MKVIVLDAGPLGLLVQRRGVGAADQLKEWVREKLAQGAQVVIPEIVDYELRRELLRLKHDHAIARLDAFESAHPSRYLPLTTTAVRRAAELWAELRARGIPTADPHALDVDVLLAAQVQTQVKGEAVVATSNVGHLGRLVLAEEWSRI